MDNTNPFSAIFMGNDPNINSQLRQRIALAMLAKQKRYPKTFGEGLSAIGESLGEMGTMRRIEQQDLADQAKDKALESGGAGGVASADTAAPPTRTAYAPPADVPAAMPVAPPSTEPAAPTALAQLPLANNSEGLTNTPPAGQASMLDPNLMLNKPIQTPPAGQFTPRDRVAAALAPSEGGYNILDAQAGMPRIGTARGQAAGERAYPGNPDMQAYASQLNAAEQPRPGDTSSTGARGAFQFIPSTAKQYGLTNPDNDMASADALKALTADNAAAFERINGRPPSMADLALMHQQGGVTGARMAGGTGNASPANLAVNNVPPGAGPAAAAAKIKSFYGMPERPVDPRAVIAEALQGQQRPPMMAFDGQPSDANAQPPMPLQATPQQPPIAQAPPQRQIAQAPQQGQPTAIPGYVPPDGGPEPPVPAKTSYSQAEVQKMQQFNEAKRTGNTYTMERTAKELAVLAEKRQYDDARNLDVYKEKLKQRDEANKARELARTTQAGRKTDYEKAQEELVEKRNDSELIRRSNMKPEELYKRLDADKQSVDQAIKAQSAQALARKAIKDGVITGYGADMKLASAKFADWAFKNGMKGDVAANTEILRAAQTAGLSEAIKTINGEGGVGVSNTDVKIAQGTAGADINLQQKTIQTIMDRAAEINHRKINKYEDYVEKTLGGLPVELRYRSTHGPTAPAKHIDMLMKDANDPSALREFDEKYGPGAAELELARVKRLQLRRMREGG
jgi:hypothetical protein